MASRVVHQSFLPNLGRTRAFVWKHSPLSGGRRPRHFHSEPELNLIVTGSATFGVGEGTVRVTAGDLIGFSPGQDHVLLGASPDLFLYAIGVESRLSSEVLGNDASAAVVPLSIRVAPREVRALANRASEIVERGGEDQRGAELWEHAHWLRRRSENQSTRPMHVLTRRTLQLLSDFPDLDLDGLARRLRANPSEISRHFHRDMNMTLVRYRARLRILRFIQFVDESRDNLMACAGAAGFGSYSQCHRVFQAELGCAPRQFFSAGARDHMNQLYEP